MSRKPKLTPEQIREIVETIDNELPIKKYERGEFYKQLAEQYQVGLSVINGIKGKTTNKSSESYWRLSLKKEVTKEKAIQTISEMYKELTGKEPDKIKLIDRYSTVQVYILPEKLIFQFDEIHMCDFNKFTITAYHSLHQCYKDYLKRTNNTKNK